MNDQASTSGVGGAVDTAKLVGAIVLVFAGLVAFYALRAQPDWLRWLAVVAGVLLAAVVFGSSERGKAFWQFMLAARLELRKVVWPERQETLRFTAVVFIFVATAGVFFWLLDVFLAWATRHLTGQGG
jgi:preprotein translocase subunit SecE